MLANSWKATNNGSSADLMRACFCWPVVCSPVWVAIVAHNTSLSDLQNRVDADPFVAENVVKAEILEITPSKADARLDFLFD